MNVCWTVDVEHDCPPFLTTTRGIDEGMPRLLELFEQEQVRGTFFITGDIARRFPATVAAIRDGGHEIGCHGDTHTPFDTLDEATARSEIQASSAVLREFGPVTSFRAPNLRFPDRYVALLEEAGYRLDSSQAKYKRTYWFRGPLKTRLARVPASMTSSVLRIPRALRYPILGRLADPAVLFVHPWEFVDFRESTLRLDCRFRTGQQALDALRQNMRFYRARGAKAVRMDELETSGIPTANP
jgi:peptidoglycan/xylan/chitin deacetylase (PgdA/CDA1 family)